VLAPRTSYPLPAQHPFGGLDAWRLLSLRAAASPTAPFLTWHPFDGDGRTWSYREFARDALAVAAVVARPDVKLDEVPVAFVVADGSAGGDGLPGQVIAACAAKLADFKVPHQVTVVAALPRSTISKVNKAALRTFLNSSDPLEQAERNWLAEAAADPSGDAR
jgi:hypothetical protein